MRIHIGIVNLVRTQNFPKTNISYPLILHKYCTNDPIVVVEMLLEIPADNMGFEISSIFYLYNSTAKFVSL